MHDQSTSRISGRTRTAVSAMCVRALRMTVLKSAGNFTRYECHDLSAEKIQRVNVLCSRGAQFVACQQFSNAAVAGWVRKFQPRENDVFVSSCGAHGPGAIDLPDMSSNFSAFAKNISLPFFGRS